MITNQTLKNAARAIECDLWTDPSGANYLVKDGAILRRWEPETSSADSFELMAQLNLEVMSLQGGQVVQAEDYYGDFRGDCKWSDDRAQDYRVAILVCAGKIGAAL